MQIFYCDLCGQPVKDEDRWILYVSPPLTAEELHDNYKGVMSKVNNEKKEICPNCKNIFDKMFELRLQKLSEMTQDILGIYNLPTKPNPKERKGRGKK